MDEERGAWIERAMANHEAALLRLCFAYLGDAGLAEDAVQETYVKASRGMTATVRRVAKRPG